MKKYIIERNIPGVHSMSPEEYKGAAAASNAALNQLAPRVQWVESYISEDKTFCVYIAEDEAAVREHAVAGGFPADSVNLVTSVIDPTTGE